MYHYYSTVEPQLQYILFMAPTIYSSAFAVFLHAYPFFLGISYPFHLQHNACAQPCGPTIFLEAAGIKFS